MNLLWNYVKQHKRLLVIAIILATINQVFSLLDPQVFRLLIDNYASKGNQIPSGDFIKGVLWLMGAYIGVALVSRVAKNFQDYYVNVIVQRVGARIYGDGIEHAFGLPFAAFEDQRSGELLSKLQKARTDCQTLINNTINLMYLSAVGVTFVIIYAFILNFWVGLTYLLMIPTVGVSTYYISRKIKSIQTKIVKRTADLAGSTTETLRNVELVKSLGLESQEVGHLNYVNEQILQLELEKIRQVRKLSFIQGTLINGLRAILMFTMLYLINQGAITLGEFFSILFYSFFIFNPLAEMGTLATNYQEARASMENLQEVLKTPIEEKPENPINAGTLNSLKFEDVSFGYQSVDHLALEKISFELTNGRTIAFAGPTGSGKTTIIKLIVGLYKPSQGQIKYNDISIDQIDLELARKQFGFVSQDTQLFAGTIRENMLFVEPKASDEEIINSLKSASALPIIERGDKGLDTRIGEGGLKLSGGEKQRLAIARALLRKPDVLIFDEATSALDSLTEESITHTIKSIKDQRPELITVMVAHRLSTIAHADTIYVLEKGKLSEHGKHEDLLKNKGLYYAMWRQQTAEQK